MTDKGIKTVNERISALERENKELRRTSESIVRRAIRTVRIHKRSEVPALYTIKEDQKITKKPKKNIISFRPK